MQGQDRRLARVGQSRKIALFKSVLPFSEVETVRPDWSTIILQRDAGDWLLSTLGFHRGMFISASRSQAHGEAAPSGFGLDAPSQQDTGNLTRLFNDQIA